MGTLLHKAAQTIATGLNGGIPVDYLPMTTSNNQWMQEQMFINNSQSSPIQKKTLLNKLKHSNTLDSIAPDAAPFTRLSLNPNNSGYVVSIDDIDNGNLPDAFIDTLNMYKGEEIAYVYQTNSFYSTDNTSNNTSYNTDFNKIGQTYTAVKSKRSIFNPYFAVKSNGFSTNKPLLDTAEYSENKFIDTSDCSVRKLLELSGQQDSELGTAAYRLADFMYCKDLGKVSNNHLLTLRRYATPVGDNIFKQADSNDTANPFAILPDIGRLVTWFGTDENKLSDILKMSFYASWKEMEAEIQQPTSNDSGSGILGMIANSLNPNYNKLQGMGGTDGKNLFTAMGANFGTMMGLNMGNPGDYVQNDIFKNYDDKKIYTPRDTIQSNHYYEGKLNFANEFTLNFSYKLRAYGDMNQKAVMLDLINNILRVTYTKGEFWGGTVKFIGPPGNNTFLEKVDAMIDDTWDKLSGFAQDFLNGSINWQDIMGSLSDAVGDAVNFIKDAAQGSLTDMIKEGAKDTVQFLKKINAGDALKGQLKNALGRPAIYALNSFVSGADLGLWHLTVGNPRNPIASIGNLILTNAELTFGDTPLGLDDFPTEIKIAVSLKHCRPRDMVGIGHIFTKGESGLALPIGQTGWARYHEQFSDPGRPAGSPFNQYATSSFTHINDRYPYGEYTLKQKFGTGHYVNIGKAAAEQS